MASKFERFQKSGMTIPLIISIISGIALALTLFNTAKTPTFETVPTQLIKDEKFFDVFITYDKVLTLEPFQTITGKMDVRFNNNYANMQTAGAPTYSPPILLDYPNDNSTSLFKSTDLIPIDGTNNNSYSGSYTVSHTNARIGPVTENLILQVLTTSTNGNNITYVPVDIEIPFLVILEDFNPLIYLLLIVLGVAVSLFVTEYAEGSKISRTRILFWLVLSVITAAVVFNQFKEALTPNSELFANVILAFAFGFGAQRILTEATSSKQSERGSEDPKKKKPDGIKDTGSTKDTKLESIGSLRLPSTLG
jgi:hypothetical protein